MNIFFEKINFDSSAIPNSQNNPYTLLIMLLVFSIIFYFIILRPQQKRANAHKKLMLSLSNGDEVLTSSGFIGYILKITSSDYVVLKLNENNSVLIKKDFITSILPKGTIKLIK
ncbi:yajC [Wigglesworthia glossinidia endosymbiont of Glossina brevipalpis]|uniref:Sec translocon accessory complex subunit YajC n=1 Tax=Wigglesworthia glossinidia brevipalpis TaxID=36870 RepID=Q8D2U7_WIGBR|nr:yajC [Wigglesworthia glossinidia endosymbiont of Glossina brevipalpis]